MNEQKTAWIKISMIFVLFFALMGVGFAGTVGDVNGDGEVSLAEAIYALRVVAGLQPEASVEECITCSGTLSAAGRWCDPGDGTVKDMTTGLIWVKNAGCRPSEYWEDAAILAVEYFNGETAIPISVCGLTDGSRWGDWRLPTIEELITITQGEEPVSFSETGFFTNVLEGLYWTSSGVAPAHNFRWAVDLSDPGFGVMVFEYNGIGHVLAVRQVNVSTYFF